MKFIQPSKQLQTMEKAEQNAILWFGEILAAFFSNNSRRRESRPSANPPVQIHIPQCPDCEKKSVQTSRGEIEVGQAEFEQAECDSQICRPGQRNTTSIPPATRRFVLSRARYKCERPGCALFILPQDFA